MWQIYQGLVFCVTCSILSYLVFPASVALVVCGFLALLFLLNDYILWRYLSVHVASIYYWIVSVYNFLANMYHQSNNTNGPDRRYIDSSGTSGNNIGLYRKNNPNPNYNLISSYSLRNESGLSKSFQSPLKSLRYSIDSSLSDATRGENDSNVERVVISGIAPRSKSSVGLDLNSRKYQHLNSDTTRRIESQHEAGLLTPSIRFNLNLNPKLYADINSPGFCGRIAEKLNESLTHQAKYSTVGSFPIVNLNSKSHNSHSSYRNNRVVSKTPVRMRIAPPDMSVSNLDSSILRQTSIGSDESMKSVLQVLREISRKRIHTQENEEDDDNTKRIRTSEFEDVTMEENPSSDQLAQGKRPREDSPRNEEVKRQRRQFRNNEILSSLSSSMTIQPPHLVQSKKRKAQNGEELQAIISTKGKLLKFQTTTPSPPSIPKQEENVSTENKQQIEEKMTPRLESHQETPKLPIMETPNLKRVVVSDIAPLPKDTTPSNTESLGVEKESVESPRLFGRFSPSKIDGVKEDNDGDDNEVGLSKHNETGLSKLIASPPKEQMSRLQDMLSSIDSDYNDFLPTFNEPGKLFMNRDKPKKIESAETIAKISSFNSVAVTKPSSAILSVSLAGEKLSKSVSFSDPIAVTKVISDSESSSSIATSIVTENSEFKALTHDSAVLPMKDEVVMKESGGLNLGSPPTPILKTTTNLSSGFNLNKIEQNQAFSSPSLISATAVTTSVLKPSINFNVSSGSSPPKSITSSNSTSVANNVFNSSPSTLTNSLGQTSMALPITQTSSPNLISPFTMSATNVTSISQTKPSPSISFSSTSTANPITEMKMFGSVSTNSTPTTSEAPKTGVFSFSSATPKTQPENTTTSSVFGTNASQGFSLSNGNTMFGNSTVKSSSSTLTPESKSVFSINSGSQMVTKPSFLFGSGNTSDPNQNKPMFGNVFGTISSTTPAADKTSSPFGNVFNPVATTQSNPILGGFGNTNKTTPTVPSFAMSTTQQSTPNMFSTPSTNSLQSQNSTNLQKTENSGNVFGGSTTNPETKTDGFGSSKPATNGFAFAPVTTSSSIFGNVFSGSIPAQSSPVSKTTPSFVGFGTPQVAASTTPSPFSFGSTAPSSQSSSVFGSVPTTTAPSVFSFGSNSIPNSAQSSSVFGAPMNSTPQANLPFGSALTPQTTLSFGAATPNSTVQTTAFGINSTQKTSSGFGITPNSSQTNSGFGITPNSSQTNSTFGVTTTNAAQPTNSSFNPPAANSGFPSLTNGTTTNTSTFGSTFGALSGASQFGFGGSTTNSSGFTFGGGSTTSTTSPAVGFGTPLKPVSFNATPSQSTVNPPPNVFAFGQQPAATPTSTQLNFQFNAGSTQPSTGGFHFNPASATPPNAFQIGAPAPAATTMFTLGSGSSAGSSTSRLKAIPRVRRQK